MLNSKFKEKHSSGPGIFRQSLGGQLNADTVSPYATCLNDYGVLRANLLRSPDVAALGVRIYENQRSAASAFNDALAMAPTGHEYTIFVHQDMYLPAGWLDKVQENVAYLASQDPSWAVLGCFGTSHAGRGLGHVYDGRGFATGQPFGRPTKVRTLDEIVLIVRRMRGLRFSEDHPGFHMYGTDICLRAERLGMSCYVIDNKCVHNARHGGILPLGFYAGYRAIMRNFAEALPVKAPCATVTKSAWPIRLSLLRQALARFRGRVKMVERAADPTAIFRVTSGSPERDIDCPVEVPGGSAESRSLN